MILWFVRSVRRGGVGGYFGWFLILTVGGRLVVMFWVLFVFSFSCFLRVCGVFCLCLCGAVWDCIVVLE